MTVIEKVSYLKGLAEGLGLDESNKHDKLIRAMIDVLDGIAAEFEMIDEDMAELSEQIDAVDEDLADVEEFLYDDEEDDDFDDDDFVQVTCPECNEDIFLDPDALDEDYIDCPACGTKLEFEFETEEDED